MRRREYIPFHLGQVFLFMIVLATNTRGLLLSNFSQAAYIISNIIHRKNTTDLKFVEIFMYLFFPILLYLLNDKQTFMLYGLYGAFQIGVQAYTRNPERYSPFYQAIYIRRTKQTETLQIKADKVKKAFSKLLEKANIGEIELHFDESSKIEASCDLLTKVISIDIKLLEILTVEETTAVIAHEISHLALDRNDVYAYLLNGFLNRALIRYVNSSLVLGAIYAALLYKQTISNSPPNSKPTYTENELNYFVSSFFFHLLIHIFSVYCATVYRRKDEIYADKGSVELTQGKKLINALEKLERLDLKHMPSANSFIPALDRFYKVHPTFRERSQNIESDFSKLSLANK